ncbi:MAG: non-homologous end-joining DNA ligase [Pseudomonadota bacterium]|nr:non-homologous end-joining DNA ligase [Pseudomonadota bacterium]
MAQLTPNAFALETSPPPAFINPEFPAEAATPPTGGEWLHEIKYDGYRASARIENAKVKILTRRGHDWTSNFKAVADELVRLPVSNAMLDGEMVALRDDGTSSFRELASVIGARDQTRLHYFAFDLLHLNGYTTLNLPLIERKKLLREILPGDLVRVHYVDHLLNPGPDLMQHVDAVKAEGIVSKRMASRYHSGEHKDWLKIKCWKEQEMVIGGFTGHNDINGLLVGYYDDKKLRFAGRIKSHFSAASELFRNLNSIRQEKNPFHVTPKRYALASWVKPSRVIQVRFLDWTKNGLMDHPSFQGLRQDKKARDVRREGPAPV